MAIPLLASPQGGVAERSNKYREASFDREDGVVFRSSTNGKPPRLHRRRWLRDFFLMMQPPLLAVMQGGEWPYSTYSFTPIRSHVLYTPAQSPRITICGDAACIFTLVSGRCQQN